MLDVCGGEGDALFFEAVAIGFGVDQLGKRLLRWIFQVMHNMVDFKRAEAASRAIRRATCLTCLLARLVYLRKITCA